MKRYLAILLLTVSTLASAQTGIIRMDMSDRSRPRDPREFLLTLDSTSKQPYLLPFAGAAFPLKLDYRNVAGLLPLFSGYYAGSKVDSLLLPKANKADVYTKQQVIDGFRPSSYVPTYDEVKNKPAAFPSTIPNVAGLKDTLFAYLRKSDYQAIQGDTSKTGYRRSEADNLFANRVITVNGLNDRYTKVQTDNKIRTVNARDIAALGGYSLPGDGSDETAALQYVVTHVGGSGGSVFIPIGKHVYYAPLVPQAGIIITGSFATTLVAGGDFTSVMYAGNDATCMIQAASNTTLEYLNLDIQGHNCGGIYSIGTDNVTVQYCSVRNWRGPALGRFGIAMLGASNNRILYNTVFNGDHGIHGYDTFNTVVIGNFINGMISGGLYTGWSNQFTATSNIVFNCGDVGADFEGGTYCYSIGNTVRRCGNGELAIFSGNNEKSYVSHHLIHSGNVAQRERYYTRWNATGTSSTETECSNIYGALCIMSLDEGCYETGFAENKVTTDWGPALYHSGISDKSNRRVFVSGNKIELSTYFWRILSSDGLTISGNSLRGLAGTETSTNETRDCHNLLISRNDVRFDNPKTSGYVFFINTSNTFATIGATVEYNTFTNVGAFASQYDPFNNTNLVATYRANDFGRFFTTNGGIDVTGNGTLKLYNQQLRLSLVDGANDLSAINALKRLNGAAMGIGTVGYGRDGFNGSLFQAGFIKGSGNYNASITQLINTGSNTDNIFRASASGGTITLTKRDDQPATGGRLSLTVDSYN